MKNLLIVLILPITLFLASCGSDSNPSKKSVDQNIQNAIDDISQLDEDEDTESAPDDGTGVDFFLQEAGNILADLIDFSSNKMEKSTPSELALKNRPAERKP